MQSRWNFVSPYRGFTSSKSLQGCSCFGHNTPSDACEKQSRSFLSYHTFSPASSKKLGYRKAFELRTRGWKASSHSSSLGATTTSTVNTYILKYLCLGDVAIFLAFGPLLMGFTSVLLAGDLRTSVLPYTLPVGLLTEAILHANNMRDIKSDTRAGIYTLASVVGFGPAKVLYALMVFGAFLVALAMAVTHSLGCALVLPALPLGVRNIADLQPHSPKMKNMDERTAQLHLLYGALLIAGVAGSDRLAALLGTAH